MDVTPEPRRGAVGIFSSVFLVGNALGAMVFGSPWPTASAP
jgi:hypothetical protein